MRKILVAVAATTLSVGLIAISAPSADADSSWGNRGNPYSTTTP